MWKNLKVTVGHNIMNEWGGSGANATLTCMEWEIQAVAVAQLTVSHPD